jgi:hypothetical protein
MSYLIEEYHQIVSDAIGNIMDLAKMKNAFLILYFHAPMIFLYVLMEYSRKQVEYL